MRQTKKRLAFALIEKRVGRQVVSYGWKTPGQKTGGAFLCRGEMRLGNVCPAKPEHCRPDDSGGL